ncbi:MAG: hypothetical protein J6C25_08715 [Treponema sp.]|nr:hypothetical protein [Treponema sp.]MBP3562577.1 hypothetical protein [Treponema sp.]
MKKMNLKIAMALSLLVISVGCKTEVLDVHQETEKSCNSEIACNIQKMKNEGLFNDLLNGKSRSAISSEEQEKIELFINNTDEVLANLAVTEDGRKELAVIEALFGGGTTDDFVQAFSEINPDKAAEFSNTINENFTQSNGTETSRSITRNNSISFKYYSDIEKVERGAYAANFDWDTIAWYSGFCAATVAGFYLASYGFFPWLQIAGVVAATAGTISMCYQLGAWLTCQDFTSFISALFGKDSASATRIANGEIGTKLLLILTETAATVVASYFAPAGATVINAVIEYTTLIIDKILSVLPRGVSLIYDKILLIKFSL